MPRKLKNFLAFGFLLLSSLTVSALSSADIVENPGHLCVTDTLENSSCGKGEINATQTVDGGEFPGEDESRPKKAKFLESHPNGIVRNQGEEEMGSAPQAKEDAKDKAPETGTSGK